jgi:hypothetical protein
MGMSLSCLVIKELKLLMMDVRLGVRCKMGSFVHRRMWIIMGA